MQRGNVDNLELGVANLLLITIFILLQSALCSVPCFLPSHNKDCKKVLQSFGIFAKHDVLYDGKVNAVSSMSMPLGWCF